MTKFKFMALGALLLLFASCKKEDNNSTNYTVNNPDTAPEVSVDRFSDDAATLMKRSANSSLPAANAPINYDQGEPFMTMGLGPGGEKVEYYNFDVQPTAPAPIYVLFRSGENMPVSGQLNIVDDIPGDADYNDFWQVYKVTVPASYVANTASSLQDIMDRGFDMTATNTVVNCPVVPKGSTAGKRLSGADNGLTRGWYKDEVVYYFNFTEKDLQLGGNGMVPLSPIYVTFNVNPNPSDPMSGPPSGFKSETGTSQTHNVIATLPSDAGYSPLWRVNVYDNADFNMVMDLGSATSANILAMGVANVNCPVVSIQ